MRVRVLGAPVDCLTMEQAENKITDMINNNKTCRVITLNPEFLYQAAKNGHALMGLLERADLVTADGEGVVWAGRVAGAPILERVTGIDLMLRLVEQAAVKGWGVYLLGAAPGVAEEAAKNLCGRFPGLKIAGTHHGYFKPEEEKEIARAVKQAAPRLLFVAIGAPKQEFWIDRYIDQLGPVAAVGVGGSLDVIAGRVTRAPRWMQRLKIEWLGRLLMEPSRWRRMLVLPKFMLLVLKTYRFSRNRA